LAKTSDECRLLAAAVLCMQCALGYRPKTKVKGSFLLVFCCRNFAILKAGAVISAPEHMIQL